MVEHIVYTDRVGGSSPSPPTNLPAPTLRSSPGHGRLPANFGGADAFDFDISGGCGSRRGERGVEFEGPPKKQPWGSYVIMKDSEGNRLVLGSD